MSLFKGYVTTKDKKCTMKFKDARPEDLLTYEQVKNLPEFAGILAEDTVLIDIDDAEQAESMMDIVEDRDIDCKVFQTTHGMHFYFINDGSFPTCKTKVNLACGIRADIKVGTANSYAILKYGNKERECIWGYEEDANVGAAPVFFRPAPTKRDFSTLTSGSGRNQALFNYILTLQSNGFSNDDAREAIRVLNDYVLPDPLDGDELETILRDEAFRKPNFFKGKSFLHDKFAQYLKSNYHIKRINGTMYIYEDGVYKDGQKEIEAAMIKHIPGLNRSKRAEVLSYLDLLVKDSAEVAPAHYIAFKNGVYDMEKDKMLDFDPDLVITNKINYNYVPGAYHELCDKTLDKMVCYDEQIRQLLEESIGYGFYRRNELRKCFILTGERQNGKSTYLSMLETLFKGNDVSLDLKELSERFKTAQLAGKLVNIGDDIGDEFIPNPAIFKKLVAGNPINVERKGQDPFDFSNYAKFYFSANNIPRLGKGRDSAAIMSRLIIIPFDAYFSVNDPDYDPYIKYKLVTPECMEYLIQIGVRGLRTVLEQQAFTNSDKVAKKLQEYEENANPVLLFFKEEPPIEREPSAKVFREYTGFCAANGLTPLSNIEFSKQVRKYKGLKSVPKRIDGEMCRVYVKEA